MYNCTNNIAQKRLVVHFVTHNGTIVKIGVNNEIKWIEFFSSGKNTTIIIIILYDYWWEDSGPLMSTAWIKTHKLKLYHRHSQTPPPPSSETNISTPTFNSYNSICHDRISSPPKAPSTGVTGFDMFYREPKKESIYPSLKRQIRW